jgi:hypothetical protein
MRNGFANTLHFTGASMHLAVGYTHDVSHKDRVIFYKFDEFGLVNLLVVEQLLKLLSNFRQGR